MREFAIVGGILLAIIGFEFARGGIHQWRLMRMRRRIQQNARKLSNDEPARLSNQQWIRQ